IRDQSKAQIGRLPDVLVACVGGGSNAMGTFAPFLGEETELLGAEAGGLGLASGKHAASLTGGRVGILHGARSYLLQDEDGQVLETHSISAGLDYPGVGPQLAELKDTKRASFVAVTDEQALEGFRALARACEEGGADVIELGIPFSDSIADGPEIQRAGQRSLRSGTRTRDVLALVASLRRRTEIPLVLMSYANPVFAMGLETFAEQAREAGVVGRGQAAGAKTAGDAQAGATGGVGGGVAPGFAGRPGAGGRGPGGLRARRPRETGALAANGGRGPSRGGGSIGKKRKAF